jgi:hypothetical protein
MNKLRPAIVFDLDDTVFDLKQEIKNTAKTYFNRHLNDLHFARYDRLDDDPTLLEVIFEVIGPFGAFDTGLRLDALKFRPFFSILRNKGYRVLFSSARGCWCSDLQAFNRTVGQLNNNRIPHDKVMINKKGEKLKRIRNVHMLIDDHIDNLTPYTGKNIKLFLLTQPWNASCQLPTNIKRISSLMEILGDI